MFVPLFVTSSCGTGHWGYVLLGSDGQVEGIKTDAWETIARSSNVNPNWRAKKRL